MDYGTLRVVAKDRGDGYLEISVSDSGSWYSVRKCRKFIFDRFRQAEAIHDYPGRPRGTGLGLAICKQIVEHFNGAIRVESEPGNGSTFSFYDSCGVEQAHDTQRMRALFPNAKTWRIPLPVRLRERCGR